MAAALAAGARVVLTAEAGYGKTTLLDEALVLLGREAVRLSGRDDDLDARARAALAAGAVVVLDDADQLPAAAVGLPQKLLDSPAPSAVVVAARRSLALALGRLRAEGTLVELTAAELAFGARECEELLRARRGRDPVAGDVERVMQATEGWPFGVALAAGPGTLGRLWGDGADAQTFLRQEVLDRVSSDVRAALFDAATPDELDEHMASAVGLDAAALARLSEAGVFLRPCDPQRRAYRFHPLFRSLLLERAAAERPAARSAQLHARVAAALAGDGWSPAAVEHWLAAGDWRIALAAVCEAGPVLAATPVAALGRWRAALCPEASGEVGERVLEGALASVTGRPKHAVAALDAAVARAREDGAEAGEWTARALLADALRSLGEADRAAEAARGFDGPAGWRAGVAAPAAAMSAALALAAAGRDEESRALAGAALHHPAGGSLTGLEHLRQALLDLPRGRLDGALARVRNAADALQGADPLGHRAALLACAATLLGEQGLDDDALATWDQAATSAAARGDRRLVAAARAERALLHARAGRLADAELELGRAESAPGGWRSAHEAARAAVAAVRGDAADALSAADRAVAAAGSGPLGERLLLAATLAPLMADAGAPALAAEMVATALAIAHDRLPGPSSGWARARLLVQRAWLARLCGDEAAADADVAAAWSAAGAASAQLVRREWPRLRGLVWGALERGRLTAEDVLPSIERAWPGSAALLPFTEHPLAAVRRRAVAPVVASGHPRALGQLKDLAREPDPAVAAAARTAIESVRQAPPPLTFRLLGGFEARRGAWRIEPSAWGRPMTVRLVRFLLVHRGRVVPEDVLFEAFWSSKPAASARRNLQVAVSMARGVLDTGLATESVIESVEHGYRLRLADHDVVDAEEFETTARAALAEADDDDARRALLEHAAALWQGEPLPEDSYADWSRDWRRALTDLYAGVLDALVQACREEGDHRATIAAATRLLELDPLNEAVHRDLMAAYARSGRIADALRQYLHCRRLLVDELGVEPSAATSLMQGRILAGDFA